MKWTFLFAPVNFADCTEDLTVAIQTKWVTNLLTLPSSAEPAIIIGIGKFSNSENVLIQLWLRDRKIWKSWQILDWAQNCQKLQPSSRTLWYSQNQLFSSWWRIGCGRLDNRPSRPSKSLCIYQLQIHFRNKNEDYFALSHIYHNYCWFLPLQVATKDAT